MKQYRIIISLIVLVFLAVPFAAAFGQQEEEEEEKPEVALQEEDLETLAQRFSYAFGFLSGMSFIEEGMPVEIDSFTKGVADAYGEEDPLISLQEMSQIMENFERGRYSPDEFQEERPEEHGLDTLGDQFSYSMGFLSSLSFMHQGIELDVEIFSQSVRHVYDDQEPIMSVEDMNEAIMEYQLARIDRREEEKTQAAAANLEEAEEFLDENAQRDEVETTESGLQYEVLEEGEGSYPSEDDTVTVHYTGTLLDGSVFDSSRDRDEPVTFLLKEVIPGWTEGLQLMRAGSTFKLYLHPDLAYGQSGAPPYVGPNELLTFEVEFLEIE